MWTSSAVSSNLEEYERNLFRFIDLEGAQAILNIVDSAAEVEILESVLYRNRQLGQKVPPKIHRLLARPFELRDPAHPSRFRGGYEPGVLYSAESIRTCALERGFHKVRFLRESPTLVDQKSIAQTLINFDVRTTAIDIRVAPYSRKATELLDPSSYTKSQEFADIARAAGAGAIIYSSARGISDSPCVAVLRSDALKTGQLKWLKNIWSVRATQEKSIWLNSETNETFEFQYN